MWETQCNKLGNRLTRRPCKGDEFEILIFEGKRQNAGICRSRQKMFAKWAFISIGRRVTQEWKFAFRLRGDSILLFKGQKKNIRNLWFSIIRVISGRHSLFQFFPLLDASGARALVAKQNPQSATRQRCDTMSSCRPMCTFLCARFGFFCGSIDGGRHNMMPPIQTLCYLAQPLWQQRNIFSSDHIYISFSVNIYKSRHNNKFEPTHHPHPPPDDHTTACATCAFSVTSRKCSSRTLIHPPDDHTTACATCASSVA